MTWIQSLRGNRIDLVNPTVEQVDFPEIAETLARINRYNGASFSPISVAQHTLIAFDAAPDELRPWVLLHDAHETRLGDITAPMLEAIDAVETSRCFADTFDSTLATMRQEHDAVIHAAAGLSMPTKQQAIEIFRADIRALQTERRDFLSPCRTPWPELDLEQSMQPLPKVYRWRPIDKVADDLLGKFRAYLPALRERQVIRTIYAPVRPAWQGSGWARD